MSRPSPTVTRSRGDLCPGALRPWPAEDGLLVRLRLVGGLLPVASLTSLLTVSEEYADGAVHLTRRANLQLRALPADPSSTAPAAPANAPRLHRDALAAIEATGMVPSRAHELVRNILVSPQTGLDGGTGARASAGRTDLRPVAAELDRLLLADPELGRLPGRFLFTLDDGRGDLVPRLTGTGSQGSDLGLVALSAAEAQLRVGDDWGAVVPLDHAAAELATLARAFLAARGEGPDAPWHVRELPNPLATPVHPDPSLPAPAEPLPYGRVPGGTHVHVPDGMLTRELAQPLLSQPRDLVVTPWHGVLVPQEES